MRSGSTILFLALLGLSAIAHAWFIHARLAKIELARADLVPSTTTEILLVEETPPPPLPEPTPIPTPEPTPPPPEPTPEPTPEEIVTAKESPEVAQPTPEPTPIATPAPTPKPTPKPEPRAHKPKPAAAVNVPKPVVIQNTPPSYPEIARRNGWEGRVLVRVEVSAEGRPISTAIAKSSGYGVLDQSALRAVKSWRFQPRTVAGIATTGSVEVPVNFSLNR
ncbi:MAG: TonB family protein [Spartobacteria bacterium]